MVDEKEYSPEVIDSERFEQMVSEQLDTLPEEMLGLIDNVIFVTEDAPEDGSDVLGVYDGLSLAERGSYGFAEMPDTITLYRLNLIAHCESVAELEHEIRVTLVHEVAHHLGFDEARIHELGWG